MTVATRGKSVSFLGVSRHFGSVQAVADVSITVEAGEFVSLLGPSGSGKTTLLMMLAGFDRPSAGKILVGDKDVTGVAPNKRDIGMVFQKYALFPHMNVAQNLAFPLRMRGMGKAEREERIRHALDMVQLIGYEERKPSQLSGGQQQRVALARAIVFEPTVILMDEPLGALDRKLRQHMQIEIKQLQDRLGATVIYVTHDQEEALTMADRIAILKDGRMVQEGPPRTLYDNPVNPFVAGFLGEMNFLPAEALDGKDTQCYVKVANVTVEATRAAGCAPFAPKSTVCLAVRPEAIAVRPSLPIDEGRALKGQIRSLVFNGASLTVLVDLERADAPPLSVQAQVSARTEFSALKQGQQVALTWAPADCLVFGEAPQ